MALTQADLKRLKQLQQKKHRQEESLLVIEGLRLVRDALTSRADIREVYHTGDFEESQPGRALLEKLAGKTGKLVPVTSRELDTFTDTVHAQGIAAVVRFQTVPPETLLRRRGSPGIVVAIDAVSDPGNLGSMIRTCDWFGVSGLILGRNSVELLNPKVVRGTMGSIFHLPISVDADLLSVLSVAKESGFSVYVTDVHGETHFDHAHYSDRSIIVFGNEAWGVSDQILQMADARVTIRRYGSAESLNVGVACGVVLSAIRRLRHG
jgi:RNA methyltransferase, TrmH family